MYKVDAAIIPPLFPFTPSIPSIATLIRNNTFLPYGISKSRTLLRFRSQCKLQLNHFNYYLIFYVHHVIAFKYVEKGRKEIKKERKLTNLSKTCSNFATKLNFSEEISECIGDKKFNQFLKKSKVVGLKFYNLLYYAELFTEYLILTLNLCLKQYFKKINFSIHASIYR